MVIGRSLGIVVAVHLLISGAFLDGCAQTATSSYSALRIASVLFSDITKKRNGGNSTPWKGDYFSTSHDRASCEAKYIAPAAPATFFTVLHDSKEIESPGEHSHELPTAGVVGCTPSTESKESKEHTSADECLFAQCAQFPTFSSWQKAVDLLPRARTSGAIAPSGAVNYEMAKCAKGLTEKVFNAALDEYAARARTTALSNPDAWLDGKAPDASFYDINNKDAQRAIFVEKIHLPEGSTLVLHGDLHGAVHGMLAEIAQYVDVDNGFKLKDPTMYVAFLGDYVDRGIYGYECIYTLLRLKNANPGHVFLLRGNHEDPLLSAYYGFLAELGNKNVTEEIETKIYNWYALMPPALFIISNDSAVQLCHGGIEPAYNPKLLLNAEAPVQFQRLPELTTQNGFMWSDFQVDSKMPTGGNPDRGCMHSSSDTKNYLQKASNEQLKLVMIIRAHQHGGPMMQRILGRDGMNNDNQGAAKLWTKKKKTGNSVWPYMVVTLNVAEDTVYGVSHTFNYDTHGVLFLGKEFKDWTLQILRKEVEAKKDS